MAGIGRFHLQLVGTSTLCAVLESDGEDQPRKTGPNIGLSQNLSQASTLLRFSASATGKGGPSGLAEMAALGSCHQGGGCYGRR
jgi:hypothetical protein